jgi:uncharacterized protein YndB with AHSA1/START domain
MTNAILSPARLEIRHVYAVPRERVFRAWTNPEALRCWFGASPAYTTPVSEVDLRVGGRFRIGMQGPDNPQPHVAGGEYRVVDPPARLVFTWRWETPDPDEPTMLVSLDFHDRQGKTELVLVHERFISDDQRDQHATGWRACLDNLARAIERGDC